MPLVSVVKFTHWAGISLNNRNYTKAELVEADDRKLSFRVGVNLVNTSESILQFPFELLKNERKGWGRNRDICEYELFAAFQSVVTAIELLLKAKIALMDYSLLFNNKNKISRIDLINGDFGSVKLSRCVGIIENAYGEPVSCKIKDRIESMRIIRNEITHYYADISSEMFLNYIAIGLDIYIEIYRNSVKELTYDSYDRTEGFEEELSDFNEFVKIRVESCRESNGLGGYAIPGNPECPICYTWNLVVLENENKKCMFCGYVDVEES